MLIINELVKSYDNQKNILNGINLSIKRGEFIALLGASGCGKSTLFRCLTLMEDWEHGQIIFDGACLCTLNKKDRNKIRNNWAYIQQQPSLILRRTALENVLAGRLNHTNIFKIAFGMFSAKDKNDAKLALEKVGLSHKINSRADRLSGGEQQRVSIARALVQGAEIIFADEPVSSLDPTVSATVLSDLHNICSKEGISVICSLHQVHFAEQYANRIIALANGKIILDTHGRKLLEQEKEAIYSCHLDQSVLEGKLIHA